MLTSEPLSVPVRRPGERLERLVASGVVGLPMLGALGACLLPVTRLDLALCAAMFVLTMFGITGGYHRLITHRSYEAKRSLRALLLALGSMACQGPVLFWAASHRQHHQFGDRPGDPHSPLTDGLYHAHMGWMFRHGLDNWPRLVPDLLRDQQVFGFNQRYFWWVLAGLLLPALAAAPWGWQAALGGLVWGGFVRIVLAHHATWCVNSVCHRFGSRPYKTADASTNHALVALVTLGEGWHNNHHAFPASARHGLAWWQFDATYAMIALLGRLGLARNLIVPEAHTVAAKLLVEEPTA